MKNIRYTEFEKVATDLTKKAGSMLLEYRGKAPVVMQKGRPLDFATEADIAVEQFIRDEIDKRFPTHGVLGEEHSSKRADAEYIWIIDPLDGTLDYSRGLSSFGVLLALEHNGNIVVGCIHQPVIQETFSASRKNGVNKNDQSVHVSSVSSLREAIIHFKIPRCVNSSQEIDRTVEALRRLSEKTGLIREAWEDSLSLARVASGASDGYVLLKQGPKWWDVAPGILMVEEAGGKVTDMYGNQIRDRDLSRGLVASNGRIHDRLLAIIRKE